MLIKRNAVNTMCWLSVPAGEVREFWMYVTDSDEDSDYDDDSDNGGRKPARRGGIRVVNPPPDGCDSDSDSDIGGAGCTIYPGPDYEHDRYRHAHLRDFSRKAINQYNHQTGNTYEFVELVEASVVTTVKAAYIVVTFKACQSDDTMITTSFRAETHSASKSLTGSYEIETVVPLHFEPSQ